MVASSRFCVDLCGPDNRGQYTFRWSRVWEVDQEEQLLFSVVVKGVEGDLQEIADTFKKGINEIKKFDRTSTRDQRILGFMKKFQGEIVSYQKIWAVAKEVLLSMWKSTSAPNQRKGLELAIDHIGYLQQVIPPWAIQLQTN